MHRLGILSLVLAGCLLASCQTTVDVVFLNSSSKDATVTYRFQLDRPALDRWPALSVSPKRLFVGLRRSEYEISSDGVELTVLVPAGMSLRIARVPDHSEDNSLAGGVSNFTNFPLDSIIITHDENKIELRGKKAEGAFLEWNYKLRVFEFVE